MRWWFDPEHAVSLVELRGALAILVKSGVVEASIANDGCERYRRLGSDDALWFAVEMHRRSGGHLQAFSRDDEDA